MIKRVIAFGGLESQVMMFTIEGTVQGYDMYDGVQKHVTTIEIAGQTHMAWDIHDEHMIANMDKMYPTIHNAVVFECWH